MEVTYFDSSALVKLLVVEDGSDLATDLWEGCDAAVASRLAYPEVCAALAAAGRNHDLDDGELQGAAAVWNSLWAAMSPIELTAQVEGQAGRLSALHRLGGADAVHLASALAVADPDLIFAAWDRRLRGGAIAERLTVAPLSTDR